MTLLQLHLASWPKQQSNGPPDEANPAGGLSIQIVKQNDRDVWGDGKA